MFDYVMRPPRLVSSNAFRIGFVFGVLVFVILNWYSGKKSYTMWCFDCYMSYGFPFNTMSPSPWNEVANIVVAFLGSLVFGAIVAYGWRVLRGGK